MKYQPKDINSVIFCAQQNINSIKTSKLHFTLGCAKESHLYIHLKTFND